MLTPNAAVVPRGVHGRPGGVAVCAPFKTGRAFIPRTTERPATDTLFVCGYPSLWSHIATVRPDYLISILGPHDDADWPTVTGIPHLRLKIDDVHHSCTGYRHATAAHVRELLDFLRDRHPPDPPHPLLGGEFEEHGGGVGGLGGEAAGEGDEGGKDAEGQGSTGEAEGVDGGGGG